MDEREVERQRILARWQALGPDDPWGQDVEILNAHIVALDTALAASRTTIRTKDDALVQVTDERDEAARSLGHVQEKLRDAERALREQRDISLVLRNKLQSEGDDRRMLFDQAVKQQANLLTTIDGTREQFAKETLRASQLYDMNQSLIAENTRAADAHAAEVHALTLNSDALFDAAEQARDRAEHAEQRVAGLEQMIERKNAALARPCIQCGYEPKIVTPATPPPVAPSGGVE